MSLEKSVRLEFREGRSDKVYEMDLIPVEDKFLVKIVYGGRWNANNRYCKPDAPTSYAKALDIFEDLERKKRNKGYVDQ